MRKRPRQRPELCFQPKPELIADLARSEHCQSYPRTSHGKSPVKRVVGAAALAIALVVALGNAGRAAPALPGKPCQTPPLDDWSDAEAWAWGKICSGRVADFNARYGWLNPRQSKGWDGPNRDRRLSQGFLETVLLHEPFRSATPRQGVRIAGRGN